MAEGAFGATAPTERHGPVLEGRSIRAARAWRARTSRCPPPSKEAQPLPGHLEASPPAPDVVRSRPVLPYPALLAFTGEGDPDDANWTEGQATLDFTTLGWAGARFVQPYAPMERP